jgi:anthranilate 1,2-dioxygenase large subunit
MNPQDYHWPKADCTRIPYGMYRDPDVYTLEQEKIFQGPVWNYLALEAEIPNVGDFRTIEVGDIPVIVNRARDGKVHAFVNRCAHRGATVQRLIHGNAKSHVCCYHHWGYNLEGNLVGVPFARGVEGKGGLPEDFDKSEHCLRKLRVETLNGVIFGTFAAELEPLKDYLDTTFVNQLKRLFNVRSRSSAISASVSMATGSSIPTTCATLITGVCCTCSRSPSASPASTRPAAPR